MAEKPAGRRAREAHRQVGAGHRHGGRGGRIVVLVAFRLLVINVGVDKEVVGAVGQAGRQAYQGALRVAPLRLQRRIVADRNDRQQHGRFVEGSRLGDIDTVAPGLIGRDQTGVLHRPTHRQRLAQAGARRRRDRGHGQVGAGHRHSGRESRIVVFVGFRLLTGVGGIDIGVDQEIVGADGQVARHSHLCAAAVGVARRAVRRQSADGGNGRQQYGRTVEGAVRGNIDAVGPGLIGRARTDVLYSPGHRDRLALAGAGRRGDRSHGQVGAGHRHGD